MDLPRPVLLADLGGTHSRFALLRAGSGPEQVVVIDNDEASGPEAAVARFLQATRARPWAAVLAVAGPVNGEAISLTNRPWRFTRHDLSRRFGFGHVHVINDFEAVAWSLLGLDETRLSPLGQAGSRREGVKVVCGPGTGLGAAALVPTEDGGWRVVPTEAGHMSFGPMRPDEDALFAKVRDRCGPVSVETMLSGPGLARIYAALHPHGEEPAPHLIAARACAGDSVANAAVAMFVRLLGRFSGDLALAFKAYGGVYIAGGVAAKLSPWLDPAVFRDSFESHPPHRRLLSAIPTALMTEAEPGLLGCAVVARDVLSLHDTVRARSASAG